MSGFTDADRLRAADAVASYLIVAYADFANDIHARIKASMPSRYWDHVADYADTAYCQGVDMAMAAFDRWEVAYE